MTKYYRFISQEEFKNLQKDGRIINKDRGKPLFFLRENPTVYILPKSLNYKLTIEELIQSDYPKFKDFNKELFQSYMIGTTSTDYLIEIETNQKPTMSNLGYYYMDEDTEICIIENCFHQYTIKDITNIYVGDFYDWQHIQFIYLKEKAS